MKKVSANVRRLSSERRYVALPAGNYSSTVLEIVQGDSKEAYQIDKSDPDHPHIEVNPDAPAKESIFQEKTAQLIVLARIEYPERFAGRLIIQRFPLIGYQKPDGVNDEERIAKGDRIIKDPLGIDSYWANADGKRYKSETGTQQAQDNFGQLVIACVNKNEAKWDELFDLVEGEDTVAQCNINITLKQYGTRAHNHWSGFFPYDPTYGQEEEAVVETAGKGAKKEEDDDDF